MLVSAYEVEVDGIYYNLNRYDKTAEVTYQMFDNGIYKTDYSSSE